MAASRTCMNAACGETAGEWRKGWALRSGGFANLCGTCGMAYEQSIFCDVFHPKESGWRECNSCGKHLHCGCIASKFSMEVLDYGGVQCTSCMRNSEFPSIPGKVFLDSLQQLPQRCLDLSIRSTKEENANDFGLSAVGKIVEDNGQNSVLLALRDNLKASFGHIKHEQITLSVGDIGITSFPNVNESPIGSSQTSKGDNKNISSNQGIYELQTQGCLTFSLGNSEAGNMVKACCNSNTGSSHLALPPPTMIAKGRDQEKLQPAIEQVQRARHFLPKSQKSSHGAVSETSKDVLPHMRVARPPGEGRMRNQLLPRYWPRITDQELQQISGDSNSTIVPLFEKVLSASDAGRIGRLVLPKACAEAYFPPISQPEGLPIKIQDVKGKEWVFQFRFWPNNNSRMYVLEGVTPCIQSMQLQAGDTVTFSRIDPEGKLVMGFRKATNSVPLQDSQISAIANGALGNESLLSGFVENLPIPLLVSEKKRSRNIGSKSKRLHIDNEAALELKFTWEEAQDMLRPPPSAKPSIVLIEDHEFEEYEDPPILGKKTIFTTQTFGGNNQWAQCDNCHKWRRLPVDILLPSKWTCTDNTWDTKRSSCSVPDELSSKELQSLLRLNADLRKQKLSASYRPASPEQESSGLEALATAAFLGDDASQTVSTVVETTKHPRHRAGCTCIVCIQPPSGKGPKHNPTCMCNVCMTVRRRFKTLMMRKRKRQSEREETEAQKRLKWSNRNDTEADSASKSAHTPQNESDSGYDQILAEMGETHIDLNYHPERAEGLQTGQACVSMVSLLNEASLPLETYLKQNGLASLVEEQQVNSSSHALPEAPGESTDGRTPEEGCFVAVVRERDAVVDEGCSGSDPVRNEAE